MFCKNCGKQIADDAKFCPECGTSNETATSVVTENTEKAIDQKKKVSAKIIVAVVLVAVLLIGVICAVAFSSKNKDEGANKDDGATDITYLEASDEDFGLLCDLFAEMQCFADSYSYEDNDANYIAVNAVTDISSKFYSVCCEKYGLNDKELFWNSESESDPEKQYTVADEGYAKYSVEDVDWIVKNIFNVEPEKDRYIADPYNTGEEYCFWYKNEDSYYSPLYIYGGGPSYDAVVSGCELLSDGKYSVGITVNETEFDESYIVGQFEIVAGLVEVDSKRVWSFEKWERIPDDSAVQGDVITTIPTDVVTTIPTEMTTIPTQTTVPNKTVDISKLSGDRKIYCEFFYDRRFDNEDIVCFADITHDGKEDMIVGDIDIKNWEKLYIYTIKDGNVVQIGNLTSINISDVTVFLTNKSGECNLVIENKAVHYENGMAIYTEFYVTNDCKTIEITNFQQGYGSYLEGESLSYEESDKRFNEAVAKRYGEGYSSLYYFYNAGSDKHNAKNSDFSPYKAFTK